MAWGQRQAGYAGDRLAVERRRPHPEAGTLGLAVHLVPQHAGRVEDLDRCDGGGQEVAPHQEDDDVEGPGLGFGRGSCLHAPAPSSAGLPEADQGA